jgi:hypothetical protein
MTEAKGDTIVVAMIFFFLSNSVGYDIWLDIYSGTVIGNYNF